MNDGGIDIHNRPFYTSRALRWLLESWDELVRV